jgi:hypothetical protein
MKFLQLTDVSTLVIVLPSLLMSGLIVIALRKSQCLPWQGTKKNQLDGEATGSSKFRLLQILKSLASELVVYAISLTFEALVFNLCSSHLSWKFLIYPKENGYMRCLIPATVNFVLSVGIAFPIIGLLQLQLLRASTGKGSRAVICSSQFIFCLSILTVLLFLGLPLSHWLAIPLGSSAVQITLARDLVRVGAAFASVPLSIAGMVVALNGSSVNKNEVRRLSVMFDEHDFTRLNRNTDEELQLLVGMAIKAKKLDFADRVSKQLLHRLENNDH